MVAYEVIAAEGIRLDRRYVQGETIRLTAEQARYLLLNGKIRPATPDEN